jgi:hypothetical protein
LRHPSFAEQHRLNLFPAESFVPGSKPFEIALVDELENPQHRRDRFTIRQQSTLGPNGFGQLPEG